MISEKEILQILEREGIKIKTHKVSLDETTGEKTLIVRTTSYPPTEEGLRKLERIRKKIKPLLKGWFLILIPIGRKAKTRRYRKGRKLHHFETLPG